MTSFAKDLGYYNIQGVFYEVSISYDGCQLNFSKNDVMYSLIENYYDPDYDEVCPECYTVYHSSKKEITQYFVLVNVISWRDLRFRKVKNILDLNMHHIKQILKWVNPEPFKKSSFTFDI